MPNSKDNSSEEKKNSESHSQDKKATVSETSRKKAEKPNFKEKDMYRIKYDF